MNSLYNIAVQPDKDYHVGVARVYKKNPWKIFFWKANDVKIECDDPVKYNPPVSTSPFLYHSIVGKIWFVTRSLRITSLIQTIFGLLTVFYIFRLAQLLTDDKWVHIFALVIITNIPMFTYMINYLSYDNLVNLAATASIYYLASFIKFRNVNDFLSSVSFVLVGLLTKIAFGPLAVLIFVILFFAFWGKKHYKFKWVNVVSLWVLIVIFGLFYARNYFNYKTLLPKINLSIERDCK